MLWGQGEKYGIGELPMLHAWKNSNSSICTLPSSAQLDVAPFQTLDLADPGSRQPRLRLQARVLHSKARLSASPGMGMGERFWLGLMMPAGLAVNR